MTRTAAPLTAGVVILMCTMLSGVAAVTVRDAACDNDGVAALASATIEATATTTEKVAAVVADGLKSVTDEHAKAIEAIQKLQQKMAATHTASTNAMVEALQDAAASAGSSSGGGGAHVVAVRNDCPDTGCTALTSTITFYVQDDVNPGAQALLPNIPFYQCHFSNKQFKTPLVHIATSRNGRTVECKVPQFDSSDLDKTWTARVQLFAGARAEIPYVDQDHLADTDVLVSSVGPSISVITDQYVVARDLKKNDDGAHLHTVTLKLTDADTPADAFDITITSGDKRLTGKLAAVDGEDDTFNLVLTITGDDKLAATKVTIKVVDNHDREATRSFTFTMKHVSCSDRIKHVRWDYQGGRMRGSYGVKKVEELATGKYRIHWTVPFENTNYAVAGMSSDLADNGWADGHGGARITLNVMPHEGFDKYDKDLKGDAARDQYLHTDYLDVGTMDSSNHFRSVNHHHLIAMTADKDDGCDNTNVFLATYTASSADTSPASTPDSWSYNMDVVGGDGGSSYASCRDGTSAYRHELKPDGDIDDFVADGYAVAGITEHNPYYGTCCYGNSPPWWGLESSYEGHEGDKNGGSFRKRGSFCGGTRWTGSNAAPRWIGKFNSVIAFGKRNGVKFVLAPPNMYNHFKKEGVELDRLTSGDCSGDCARNMQNWDVKPAWESNDFAWVGTANMQGTSGEKLTFDNKDPPSTTKFWTRTVNARGNPSTNDDHAGLISILGVEGKAFNKDE